MKKKPTHNFSKFAPKKSNAAIKEQFKQEKRKFKKEREEYFEKKRSHVGGQRSGDRSQVHKSAPASHNQTRTFRHMPLNKFIAHAGIAAAVKQLRW